ncbi:MAG TPA: hypothetical protein VK745_01500 [Polyangiaceae bacterium]|nr:hypothetical protein [Polyangiaceae bacterium]
MQFPKRVIGCGMFALLCHSAAAHAQAAQPTRTQQATVAPRVKPSERDQLMIFEDDLLDADLATPFGDPVFSGHIRPGRVTLIRPRTSFVPELYKSVEHI